VHRLPLLARSALLWLCACSVELGSQGEVTSAIPDDSIPPGVGPGLGTPWSPGDPGIPSVTLDAGMGAAEPDAASGQGPGATPPEDPQKPGAGTDSDADTPPPQPAFVLTSPAFAQGALIPAAHTCGGREVSPAFAWSGAPANTASFVLVLTAQTSVLGSQVDWQRWAIWNISAGLDGLPASLAETHMPGEVPGALQASNENDTAVRGRSGGNSIDDLRAGRRYRGPCTYGFPQTFEFKLYAVADAPAAPAWRWGIDPAEIVQWLESKASVLGVATLGGVTPYGVMP
jgi:phosphatidylethanolamine-binding protein (PEBP) family uncharacterized protein